MPAIVSTIVPTTPVTTINIVTRIFIRIG